jgi:hypothetical protein
MPLRLAILYSCLLSIANMIGVLYCICYLSLRLEHAPAEMIEVEVELSVTTGGCYIL